MSDSYHYQHNAGNNPQYGGQGYYPPPQQDSQQGYYPPAVSLSEAPILVSLLTPSLAVLSRSSLSRSVRTVASIRCTLRRSSRLHPELANEPASTRLERLLLRPSSKREVPPGRTAANGHPRTGTGAGRRERSGIEANWWCGRWFLG